MDRRAPQLEQETSGHLDGQLLGTFERALLERHGLGLTLDGRQGPDAAVLLAAMPTGRRVHEIFVFARGRDAPARALDYLDGLLAEVARTGGPAEGFHLPLDWQGTPWDGSVVFFRGELRDYEAEREAAKLLQEAPPPRGLDFIP